MKTKKPSKQPMTPPDSDGSPYAPDLWMQWESAISAAFGGVIRDWPKWAQDAYRRHHGYLP